MYNTFTATKLNDKQTLKIAVVTGRWNPNGLTVVEVITRKCTRTAAQFGTEGSFTASYKSKRYQVGFASGSVDKDISWMIYDEPYVSSIEARS